MSFDNFSSSVKLNNIKTYNNINNTAVNTFQNTFYSDIKKIDYNKYEDIDYNQIDLEKGIEEAKEQADDQPWYKTIYDYTVTISCSYYWGMLEAVETIGDGLIMLGSATAAKYASVVDSIFATDYADKIKETASNMITYDWTEAGYNVAMDVYGVDEEISHGLAHTIAGGVGTTTGYIGISLIPGGAEVTATMGALSAAGSAAEQAFNCGASYEEALTVSVISGAAGAGAGAALNGIGGAAKGATSLVQVGGYALAGATVSMTEPLINTTAQYYLYANDMVDENGNKLYDNWGDYYVDSGGALNTVIAGVAGGSSVGIQGVKGFNSNKNNAEFEIREKIPDETTMKIFDEITEKIPDETTMKIFDDESRPFVSSKEINTIDSHHSKSINYVNDINNIANSQKYQLQLDKLSKKLNISAEEVKVILDDKIKQLVADGNFGIRVRSDVLDSVLNDGMFKNQFQTNTSQGMLNQNIRTTIENQILNVPIDADPADRPIYGMIFPELNENTANYYINGPGYWYSENGIDSGAVCILKKDSIKTNTTVSCGDSLDYRDGLTATSATNPQFNGAFDDFASKINTVEELKNATIQDLFSYSDEYLELQIHGAESHSISHIEKVLFSDVPNPDTVTKLNDLGIPWQIIQK